MEKQKRAKVSFVRVVLTWLLASAHLEAHSFPPPDSRTAQCLRRKKTTEKKTILFSGSLCVRAWWWRWWLQRWRRWRRRRCAKRGYFAAGTAALSESLQGSHIRGNVIHSLAPPASRLMNSGRITTSVPPTPPHLTHPSAHQPHPRLFMILFVYPSPDFLAPSPSPRPLHALLNFIGHR